jgi:hypothetical protein
MNQQQLIDKLLQHDARISQAGIRVLLQKIDLMSKDIRGAFENWLEYGQMPDITIEGFTIENLTKSYNLSTIAAFLTLDYLRRKPEEAILSLKMGYDRVHVK